MAFFKRDFNKPGPGVPKNAPKKKGFARFFEIIGRDFGNLLKLNLIFMLSVLPAQILLVCTYFSLLWGYTLFFILFALLALVAAIPVGPSFTAMYHIITMMLRDEPGFLWHDYKRIFKENFRSTVFPGLVYALIIASQIFAFIFYTQMQGALGFVMIAVYFFSVLLFAMAAPYFFTQCSYLDMKASGIFKNSLLLSLGYAPRSFMGALLGSGLIVAQLLFFPLSLLLTVFIGYSIPFLLNIMWIWPQLDKTFAIEETLKKRRNQEFEETAESTNKAE